MIVLMAGLPASGKSTLCREVAVRLNGTVLDKDNIRSTLFAERDIEYSTEQDDFCVQVALEAATYILRKDPLRFVFLDGRPFSQTYQIDEVVKVTTALKQNWRVLECVCSEESIRRRLTQQASSGDHPAANRDYGLYLSVKSRFEEIRLPKTVIDTDQPFEDCVRRALHAVT